MNIIECLWVNHSTVDYSDEKRNVYKNYKVYNNDCPCRLSSTEFKQISWKLRW